MEEHKEVITSSVPMEVGVTEDRSGAPRIFLTYKEEEEDNNNMAQAKTPVHTRGPPSRMGGQEIDID